MEDALRGLLKEQIEKCYNAPPSALVASIAPPVLDVKFNADGTLAAEPRGLQVGSSSLDAPWRMRLCAPCGAVRPIIFRPNSRLIYGSWKHWNMQFDPTSV